MILNKDEFENGLRSDMQSHPRANQIFGPQVNLTGALPQQQQQQHQNQQKSKRELLWEQKMMERQGLVKPNQEFTGQVQARPPSGQFQKATSFEVPLALQPIQIPQETPPQVERAKIQNFDQVAQPPPSYMIQRQEFMKNPKDQLRKNTQADVLGFDQWTDEQQEQNNQQPQQSQPLENQLSQWQMPTQPPQMRDAPPRYAPVSASIESLNPQSIIQNDYQPTSIQQQQQFEQPPPIQPQRFTVGPPVRVQDNQPAAPSSFIGTTPQVYQQQQNNLYNPQPFQKSQPQAIRQGIERPNMIPPSSYNQQQLPLQQQFQIGVQPNVQQQFQNDGMNKFQPSQILMQQVQGGFQMREQQPQFQQIKEQPQFQQMQIGAPINIPQQQYLNQGFQQLQPTVYEQIAQNNEQMLYNPQFANQQSQDNDRKRNSTPQEQFFQIGNSDNNKKKQQFQNEYLADWQNQIKLKEEQKRQAKLQERQIDLRGMKEAEEYNPFGRAGAGAPNRDFQPVHQQQQMPQYNNPDIRRSVDNNNQYGGRSNAVPEPFEIQDQQKLIGQQDPRNLQAMQEAKKRQLSQNLLQQMEELKLRKEEEIKRKKQEEALEELRLKKEREELEAKYREEESSKQKNKQQVMEENAKLIEEKKRKQSEPVLVSTKSRKIPVQEQFDEEGFINKPVQNDPFMSMPPTQNQPEWSNSNQAPQLNQQQNFVPQPPQIDHNRIVNEISEQLKDNFNSELGRLKQQMEFQQQAFERQLISLRNESHQLAHNKETAEQELMRLRQELLERRDRERAQHHETLTNQQFAQDAFMYGQQQQMIRTGSSRSELRELRPESSASQKGEATRNDSRLSNRKASLANVERNLLQQPSYKQYQHIVHPKDVQIVSFETPQIPFAVTQLQQDTYRQQPKQKKPPLVPLGTGRSRDSTLEFFNQPEVKPLPENFADPAMDLSFDLPGLPPYQGIQRQYIQMNKNSSFMRMKNPSETNKTDVSQTSVNLEMLNQRNQTRLARLEHVDNLDGSAFKLDQSRIVSSPYKLPNETSHYQVEEDPLVRVRKQANEQDIQPRWGRDKPQSRGRAGNSELDCGEYQQKPEGDSAPTESMPTQFDADCECKIEVYGSVQQVTINGQKQECLNVQVQLFESEIDEQHDLLYLLNRSDNPDSQDSMFNNKIRIPTTYKDLDINYVIKLTKNTEGFGQGIIVISTLPPGRYKIYYLKPYEPQRILKSANVKLRKVGHGQEFNIWYVSKSSASHRQETLDDSMPISITSDKVRIANSQSIIETVRLMKFQEVSGDDTPQVIEQMSETETADIYENSTSFELVENGRSSLLIHSDLLQNRSCEVINFEPTLNQRMDVCNRLVQNKNPLYSRVISAQQQSTKKKQKTVKESNTVLVQRKEDQNQQRQELARKENLQSLRIQLQKDFKEQQLKLSQSYELLKSTRNQPFRKILLSNPNQNHNILSTVEEIESSNMSQTTLFKEACAAFRGTTSSKSKLRNSSLMHLASNQKYSGSSMRENKDEAHVTANSILSGELMQLICQETIPVNEEDSDSDDVDEIFLRIQQIDNKMSAAQLSSDQTTRTNSKIGSLLIQHNSNANSNVQLSIEQSESGIRGKKTQTCKPFKEIGSQKPKPANKIELQKPVLRIKATVNTVKRIR